MTNRERKNNFTLYLFDEEKVILERQAIIAELSNSGFIRRIIAFGVARPQPMLDDEIGLELIKKHNDIAEVNRAIANSIIFTEKIKDSDIKTFADNYEILFDDYERIYELVADYKFKEWKNELMYQA